MNKFLNRAAISKIESANGKMTINEGGVAKSVGLSTLRVETNSGIWELAFMSDDAVQEALQRLKGKRVTCNYREK